MSGREQRIASGGVSLRVIDEGSGPAVLVLHGFTGCAEAMEGVAAALRDRRRVLRPDLLGHGASDAPRDTGLYTIESAATQLVGMLDALAIERAHVLGYSMGGRLALALAALHPLRVRSLLAIGARAGFADPAERAARIRDDERLADEIERDGVAAFVERWSALPLFAGQHRLGAAALAEARRQRLAQRAHGLAASLRGMGAGAQTPLEGRLHAISAPALLVTGAEDARFAALADDLAARMPRARVARIPEAGHAAHLEHPEAFASLARCFLAEVEADCPRASSPVIQEIHA
jgi:2-succinyl-6-hydroxy-2,4-cyclohexadiene-1-carboxylate synthase